MNRDGNFGSLASCRAVVALCLAALVPHAVTAETLSDTPLESLTRRLESMAQTHGVGAIVVKVFDQTSVIPTPGNKEVLVFDAASAELRGLLTDLRYAGPQIQEALLSAARNMAKEGVQARQQGKIAAAILYHRFALLVACRSGDWTGMEAASNNLWIAKETVRLSLRPTPPQDLRAVDPNQSFPSRPDAGGPIAPGPHTRPMSRPLEHFWWTVLAVLKHDAGEMIPSVQSRIALGRHTEAAQINGNFTLRRLADMAGQISLRRETFSALASAARSAGRPDYEFLASVEEVAQMTLADLLTDGAEQRSKDGTFADAWMRYSAGRASLDGRKVAPSVFNLLYHAFQNLEFVRSQAVAAGGPTGHRLSYLVSQALQPIGRDLVGLLMSSGNPEAALGFSERVRARALGDWMARSHGSNRLAIDWRVLGSSGEVRPATIKEIASASTSANAPLLMYMSDATGYSVWLHRKDGRVVTSRVSKRRIDQVATQVFRALPYHFDTGSIGKGRGPAGKAPPQLGDHLAELFEALFPPAIRDALRDQGERIVVIPDGVLHDVPFAALRTPEGKYLVEQHEIIYWPSVTTWLLSDTSSKIWRLSPRQAAVVLGNPVFSDKYTVSLRGGERTLQLAPLPGTGHEATFIASSLGVKPLLGSEARREAIVGRKYPDRLRARVLHIGTHAVFDSESPPSSFIALSDGAITAEHLYTNAGILQVELVMLSACETAVGAFHPDSPIGLTNAFLVAGSNTVGSTLWVIPDDATARLMERFYAELKKGALPAAALRKGQLELLSDSRTSDPLFWAPFKMTGHGANPLD